MKVSALLRSRVACGLLAAMLFALTMSGCSGGWGAQKPTIANQSAGQTQTQTVMAGQPTTFNVTATGPGPFTYQWARNGVLIPSAVSNFYTITTTTSSDNGSTYTVAVSNANGTTMSAAFVLMVNSPPAITLQPASQTVTAGQPATFTVAPAGAGPFTYQWDRNGALIPGAVSNSYPITATTSSDNGSMYTVAVSNAAGTTMSTAATLTVTPLVPTLSFNPIPSETYGNEPFSVTASSTSPGTITYFVVSGPATIAGNMVTLAGTGPVELMASQAASGNYAAATAMTTFTVTAPSPQWVVAWGASPENAALTAENPGGNEQSFRFLLLPTIDGTQERVHFSNLFGLSAVTIGAARVAVATGSGAAIDPTRDTPLTFAGASSITLAAGQEVVSDPVNITYAFGEKLAVSVYVKGAFPPLTQHESQVTTNYASVSQAGDTTTDASGSPFPSR